jgi:hypothetical protein
MDGWMDGWMIQVYIYLVIAISISLFRYGILSTYVCAYVCKSECARRMHSDVRARALVHECASVCARPLDACRHVCYVYV